MTTAIVAMTTAIVVMTTASFLRQTLRGGRLDDGNETPLLDGATVGGSVALFAMPQGTGSSKATAKLGWGFCVVLPTKGSLSRSLPQCVVPWNGTVIGVGVAPGSPVMA
jgi:hypothetical protein